MKKTLLGVALVCATLACQSQEKASVSDAQPVNGVKMECSDKGACTGEKKACCEEKAGEQKVCPVTGKVQG
jgi:hypothetical protein